MPQLDPTWFASQLFWLAIAFMLLYVLMSRFLLPPLMGIVGLRERTIEDDLARAESSKHQAERAKQDYEAALAQSREMSQNLINEISSENKLHAEKTMKALDAEILQKLKDASARINSKKQELLTSLTPAAAELSGAIAEKIVKQAIKPEQASSAVLAVIKARS